MYTLIATAPSRVCFKMKSRFVKDDAHAMLIYDEPLLSGEPPLSGHLPVLRGWPLNGDCIFLDINAWRIFEVPPTPLKTTNGLFTFFVWLIVNKRNRPQTKKNHNNINKNKTTTKTESPDSVLFHFTKLNPPTRWESPPRLRCFPEI